MGGAPALPTPSTPGYTSFRGYTACDCLAQWLPVYEALLLAKGLIKNSIDIWQLTGGAPASGGTHTQGGVFDVFQIGPAYVAVSREMGAPATWSRTVAQGFTKAHTHGVLSGCPHNDPAAYQITAQKRGYDGLGKGAPGTTYAGQWGYGAKDEFPDPKTYRTWQQGIAWAKTETARLTKEDDMPTPIDLWGYKAGVTDAAGKKIDAWQILVDSRNYAAQALAQVAGLTAALKALSEQPDLTAEQITAAAKAGAQAALDEKITGAVTNLTVGP